jgi:acylphosphatase
MVFSLTAIDEAGQTRDFFCQVKNMEVGFDLLSAVAAQGHILLKAQVLEGDKRTSFPTYIFDGVPFSDNIRLLETEWQAILGEPINSQTSVMENLPVAYCTVYLSTSVGLLVETDLVDILRKSRANNARLGVTGVLLYVNGSIIQVLEGEQKAVESLYRRIEQDPRHTAVTRVLNKPISQHLFGEWSMGYETITARQLANINALIDADAQQEPAPTADNHLILQTLKVFYEHNRLR